MADLELDDGAEALQAKATEHAVPVGVWLLFGGLVAWGIWYFVRYVGWNQAGEVEGGQPIAVAANLVSTVLFTVLAAVAALLLGVAMARRARGRR